MGARGPQPGFKARREAERQAALAAGKPWPPADKKSPSGKKPAAHGKAAATPPIDAMPERCSSVQDMASLPAHYRENPEKLAGEALRHLAHRRGIAKSEAELLSDEKLREQLRYLTYRQYQDEPVEA